MVYEEYKRKALEPIVNYIESVLASYSKEELEARIKEALPKKESEDEMIRKDIIGGLMWQRDNLKSDGPHDNNLILPGFCLTVGEHLAYLEKQKDKPSTADDIAAAYQMGLAEGRKEQKPALYWHKIKAYDHLPCKAYIYKFAYEQENNFHGECHIDGFLMPNEPVKIGCDTWYLPVEDIKNLPKEEELDTASPMKTVEQKPAEWSEEDEKMLRNVYESLYAYQCDIRAGIMDKNSRELLDDVEKEKQWLKYLRPQPKQEWTEKDEARLGNLLSFLDGRLGILPGWKADCKNWLLSRFRALSPQPHWKPTKVQLDALAIASERVDSSPLKALYNDLLKLM